ncbi:MAG: ATP-binding protein [Rhodospirillaceae bacterium]
MPLYQEIRLRNHLTEIKRLAETIEAFGETHGLPAPTIFKLTLVLDELVNNVIDYAFADDGEHEILILLGIVGDMVMAEVVDDGMPYDPTQKPDPDTTLSIEERPVGGLGIFFAKRMMDRVEYQRNDGHNRLMLAKRIGLGDNTETAITERE